MASEAITSALQAMLEGELTALGIDTAYAEFAAASLADASAPLDERAEGLRAMVAAALDEPEDGAPIDAMVQRALERLAELLEAEATAAEEAAAAEEARRAAAVAAAEAAGGGNPSAAGMAGLSLQPARRKGDKVQAEEMFGLDSATKAAILEQAAMQADEEEQAEQAAAAAAALAVKRAKAAAMAAKGGGGGGGGGGGRGGSSGGGIDAALTEIDDTLAGSGVDTRGLGRRAKRSALAGGGGGNGGAASGAAARGGAGMAGRGGSSGNVDMDTDSDGSSDGGYAAFSGDGPGPAAGGASGRVVAFDPLAYVPNNRQFQAEIERAARADQKAKNEAEKQRVREAQEAARYVVLGGGGRLAGSGCGWPGGGGAARLLPCA
jgi:hypothetical protein